ncbi:MAG: B12-binding domain-containing radical SAM protein [Roseburia sp.]
MKALLVAINAKYIHSNLAVYNLRAYACAHIPAEEQENIRIGEYTINNRIDYILEGIYREKPDLLCFSCYIWNIAYVEELVTEYHKLCPGVPIWVGGPEVSYEVERFLGEHPQVTGVMMGEGEQTFLELYRHYADKSIKLRDISGIAYRQAQGEEGGSDSGGEELPAAGAVNGCRLVVTAPRDVMNMDEIPFCYDHVEDFRNRIIYYETSRGCPFCCSYCLSSVEKKLRFRSLTLVKKELAFFLEKQVAQVKFVDRTFNCNHEHAMEIWRFIKGHDNGITNFHFEISADLLRPEELELLGTLRPGLVQLEIGVQSTNAATIAEIHRTMRLEQLKKTVRQVQTGENIHEHLDLIAGLPYEGYERFGESFDEVYALKPNQLQMGFLKVLKGSYLYEHAEEYGIIYHSRAPYEVMQTRWLSFGEILALKQVEEMLEVYYNSGQFSMTIRLLEPLFTGAFQMYRELGRFYDEKGYFDMSHSRLRRAEILLEFMEERGTTEEIRQLLEESLIFDLYARENCKSRPVWAADMKEWKEITRKYCVNGKQSHVERFHYAFPERGEHTVKELPVRLKEPKYVLFDYTRRDPLDYQAQMRECREDRGA